jgi:uncharacterized protein (DUF885 family)
MKPMNPLNRAQSLAAQRSQTALGEQKGLSGSLSTQAMQQKLNEVADPGEGRLGLYKNWKLRKFEANEAMDTAKAVIDHREKLIRKLAIEALDAQITLMRADLKQRFDTEFAVLAERGLAAFAQAQSSFYAVVDAGSDMIYEGLYERVNDLTARHQAGRLSDQSFDNELVRAQNQAEQQIRNLEASCAQRLAALNNAFNS